MGKTIIGMFNRIFHRLGLCVGRVITWTDKQGRTMAGWECDCGLISGVHCIDKIIDSHLRTPPTNTGGGA